MIIENEDENEEENDEDTVVFQSSKDDRFKRMDFLLIVLHFFPCRSPGKRTSSYRSY